MPIVEETNDQGQVFYRVEHPKGKARIARQGAHVISFESADFGEQLWVSRDSEYAPGKAIRGGVPICWPWFGKARQPGHGFARVSDWTLTKQSEDEYGAHLTFTLTDTDVTSAEFPFRLEMRISVGETLDMYLTTYNTGSAPIEYTGALHSYFKAERGRMTLYGLGDSYFDSTRGGISCIEDMFTLSDETDRIYTHDDGGITLHSGADAVMIENMGHDSVVVWNAGKKLVDSMPDMHAGAEQEYICVEAAITQQPQVVQPGEFHTLSQRIIPH